MRNIAWPVGCLSLVVTFSSLLFFREGKHGSLSVCLDNISILLLELGLDLDLGKWNTFVLAFQNKI